MAAYYLANHVDSVKVVTDDTGKILSRTEYLPYGETFQQEGEIKFAAKYNGQALDEESDLYYYNARHYDPEIARFVTADSVIDGATSVKGWNRYMYVGGNPIMYKDPTGHERRPGTHIWEGGDDESNVIYGYTVPLTDNQERIKEKYEAIDSFMKLHGIENYIENGEPIVEFGEVPPAGKILVETTVYGAAYGIGPGYFEVKITNDLGEQLIFSGPMVNLGVGLETIQTKEYVDEGEFDPKGEFFSAGSISVGPLGYGQTELRDHRKNGSKPLETEDYPFSYSTYPASVVESAITKKVSKLWGVSAMAGVGYATNTEKKYIIPKDKKRRKQVEERLKERNKYKNAN